MHANPKFEPLLPDGMGTIFTDGGVSYFDLDELNKHPRNEFFGNHPINRTCEYEGNARRKGYYGWNGFGGAVLQWHPELQIGFGYMPTDCIGMDFMNFRGSLLQEQVSKCAAAANTQQ